MNTVNDLKVAKGLKLVQINCRSIYGKIDEMRYLFNDIDILSCSETWLSDIITDNMIGISNMEVFRWDRQNGYANGVTKKKGGGVACYINNRLNVDCQIMKDLTFTTNDIELLCLKCVHSFGKKFYVMSLYRPPDGSLENFIDILNNILDNSPFGNTELWLMGDLNIDFLKRHDNKTKKLYDFLRLNGLKQYITTATRLTGFGRSCIDFIISNIDEDLITSCGTLNDVISDHYPTFVCVKKSRNSSLYTKTKGRTYRNYDKIAFQNLIKSENWEFFYALTNPNDLWDFILATIKTHLDIMCPLKYIRFRTNSPPWITQDVIEMINDRNVCYRKAKASADLEDLKNAKHLRNQTNIFIKTAKSNFIKDSLEQNKDNPKKFWRILNDSLLKGNKENPHITFEKGDGEYTGIPDACNYINSHFANIGTCLHDKFKDTVSLDSFNELYNIPTAEDE